MPNTTPVTTLPTNAARIAEAGMSAGTGVAARINHVTSAPMMNKLARAANGWLDRAKPNWGGGRLGNIV